jgi:hypothetical protein
LLEGINAVKLRLKNSSFDQYNTLPFFFQVELYAQPVGIAVEGEYISIFQTSKEEINWLPGQGEEVKMPPVKRDIFCKP